MKLAEIKKDLRVYYIPAQYRSGKSREGWEEGIVSTIQGENVFVRYKANAYSAYADQGKLTSHKDLFPYDASWIQAIPLVEKPATFSRESLVNGGCYVTLGSESPDRSGYLFRWVESGAVYYMRDSGDYGNTSTSVFKESSYGPYRDATDEEKGWLHACIQAGKFIRKNVKIDVSK